MNTYLTCIRPMPLTTSGRFVWPDAMRKADYVRCLCGAPTCRDADVKGKS